MGAREDFEALRRASGMLEGVHPDSVHGRLRLLLRRSGAQEVVFIRLHKAGVQAEMIDLAYAVLGEQRPGGSAVVEGEK